MHFEERYFVLPIPMERRGQNPTDHPPDRDTFSNLVGAEHQPVGGQVSSCKQQLPVVGHINPLISQSSVLSACAESLCNGLCFHSLLTIKRRLLESQGRIIFTYCI